MAIPAEHARASVAIARNPIFTGGAPTVLSAPSSSSCQAAHPSSLRSSSIPTSAKASSSAVSSASSSSSPSLPHLSFSASSSASTPCSSPSPFPSCPSFSSISSSTISRALAANLTAVSAFVRRPLSSSLSSSPPLSSSVSSSPSLSSCSSCSSSSASSSPSSSFSSSSSSSHSSSLPPPSVEHSLDRHNSNYHVTNTSPTQNHARSHVAVAQARCPRLCLPDTCADDILLSNATMSPSVSPSNSVAQSDPVAWLKVCTRTPWQTPHNRIYTHNNAHSHNNSIVSNMNQSVHMDAGCVGGTYRYAGGEHKDRDNRERGYEYSCGAAGSMNAPTTWILATQNICNDGYAYDPTYSHTLSTSPHSHHTSTLYPASSFAHMSARTPYLSHPHYSPLSPHCHGLRTASQHTSGCDKHSIEEEDACTCYAPCLSHTKPVYHVGSGCANCHTETAGADEAICTCTHHNTDACWAPQSVTNTHNTTGADKDTHLMHSAMADGASSSCSHSRESSRVCSSPPSSTSSSSSSSTSALSPCYSLSSSSTSSIPCFSSSSSSVPSSHSASLSLDVHTSHLFPGPPPLSVISPSHSPPHAFSPTHSHSRKLPYSPSSSSTLPSSSSCTYSPTMTTPSYSSSSSSSSPHESLAHTTTSASNTHHTQQAQQPASGNRPSSGTQTHTVTQSHAGDTHDICSPPPLSPLSPISLLPPPLSPPAALLLHNPPPALCCCCYATSNNREYEGHTMQPATDCTGLGCDCCAHCSHAPLSHSDSSIVPAFVCAPPAACIPAHVVSPMAAGIPEHIPSSSGTIKAEVISPRPANQQQHHQQYDAELMAADTPGGFVDLRREMYLYRKHECERQKRMFISTLFNELGYLIGLNVRATQIEVLECAAKALAECDATIEQLTSAMWSACPDTNTQKVQKHHDSRAIQPDQSDCVYAEKWHNTRARVSNNGNQVGTLTQASQKPQATPATDAFTPTLPSCTSRDAVNRQATASACRSEHSLSSTEAVSLSSSGSSSASSSSATSSASSSVSALLSTPSSSSPASSLSASSLSSASSSSSSLYVSHTPVSYSVSTSHLSASDSSAAAANSSVHHESKTHSQPITNINTNKNAPCSATPASASSTTATKRIAPKPHPPLNAHTPQHIGLCMLQFPAYLILFRLDGLILDCGMRLARELRTCREKLIGRHAFDILPRYAAERFQQARIKYAAVANSPPKWQFRGGFCRPLRAREGESCAPIRDEKQEKSDEEEEDERAQQVEEKKALVVGGMKKSVENCDDETKKKADVEAEKGSEGKNGKEVEEKDEKESEEEVEVCECVGWSFVYKSSSGRPIGTVSICVRQSEYRVEPAEVRVR